MSAAADARVRALLAELLHEWHRTCDVMDIPFTLDQAANFVMDAEFLRQAAVLIDTDTADWLNGRRG